MDAQISLIIPTFHAPHLGATLKAIARQEVLACLREVLVVGQQEMPADPGLPGLRYIPLQDRPTPARNRNLGAAKATGEVLCFTDSDCLPQPGWLSAIAAALTSQHAAIAGAVAISPSLGYWGRCDHYLGFESQALGLAHTGNLPYAATLNFCVRRDLFQELGGFDEAYLFAGGEDRDFGWKLQQAGQNIHFVPQAVVIHAHPRTTLQDTWRHLYHYGKVTAQFRLHHYPQATPGYRWGRALARIPLAGELAGLLRVLWRSATRLKRHATLRRQLALVPGMALLDLAHTLGMIHTLRKEKP